MRHQRCAAAAAIAVAIPAGALVVGTAGGEEAARPAAAAKAGVTPTKRQLVGTWRLWSAVTRAQDGTAINKPFGSRPQGKLTYTSSGQMWALVLRRGAPRSTALWYTGTFRVDRKAGTVIHTVQYSSVEAWEGTDQVRFAKLNGRRLTLTVGAANTGVVLSWKRVDSGT